MTKSKIEILINRVYEGDPPKEIVIDKIEKRWMHKHLECAVTKRELPQQPFASDIRSWRCGYVGVPKGHPMFGKSTDARKVYSISVHGGITFAQKGDGLVWTEGLWWVGFDTCHFNDKPSIWSFESAVKETEHLAKQLARMVKKK
jgi:hypothetical protein